MKGIPTPVKNAVAPPLPEPKESPGDKARRQREETARLLKEYGTTDLAEIEHIKIQRGEA
jgi:hypothetical protein